jgi:hypothetical protein
MKFGPGFFWACFFFVLFFVDMHASLRWEMYLHMLFCIRAKGVTPQWLIFLIRVGVGDPQGGGRGSGRLAPKRSCT